jgi:Flp pilus assembly pilin Flp
VAPIITTGRHHPGIHQLRTIVSLFFPDSCAYTLLMMNLIQRFLKDEEGQDLIEYTLLMAFIALASAAVFVSAGQSVSTIWGSTSTQLASAATAAS